MAATVDKTRCGALLGAISFNSLNRVYVLSNEVDLTTTTMVTTDIYQCLAIPADTQVLQVKTEILTPAVGTALTCSVGHGGVAAGWYANTLSLTANAGTFATSVCGTDANAVANNVGFFYDAADSIDIVLNTVTAITAGPKIRVSAICADFNS